MESATSAGTASAAVEAAASATMGTTAAASAVVLAERSDRQSQAKDRTANQGPHTHSPGSSVAPPAWSSKPLEVSCETDPFC